MRSLKGPRRWSVICGLLAILAVTLPFALASRAAPASADGSVTTISNSQTLLCLDGNSSNPLYPANGAVYTDACNGLTSQEWSVTFVLATAVTLTNAQTGLCLESNFPSATDPNGAVFTEGCTGGTAQEWTVDLAPDGGTGFCDVYTGLCLDSDDAGAVYTDQGNGDTYQSWIQDQIRFENEGGPS
jgi:hypothetical protein